MASQNSVWFPLSDFWKRNHVKIDVDWTGHYPILVYAEAARLQKCITLDEQPVQQAAVTIYHRKQVHNQSGENTINPTLVWKHLGLLPNA